jgi:hypothetical protein
MENGFGFGLLFLLFLLLFCVFVFFECFRCVGKKMYDKEVVCNSRDSEIWVC